MHTQHPSPVPTARRCLLPYSTFAPVPTEQHPPRICPACSRIVSETRKRRAWEAGRVGDGRARQGNGPPWILEGLLVGIRRDEVGAS